jgi:hypothetical protein
MNRKEWTLEKELKMNVKTREGNANDERGKGEAKKPLEKAVGWWG